MCQTFFPEEGAKFISSNTKELRCCQPVFVHAETFSDCFYLHL